MSKSIAVDTDDPANRVIRLTMTFAVSSPIVVRPQLRVYVDTVRGKDAGQRVLLHRSDGRPLEATARAKDLPASVHVATIPVEKRTAKEDGLEAVPGDAWIETTVDSDATPGLYRGQIVVQTNHPDLPELELPTSVRVRPLIEARPDVVQLWMPSQGGGTRSGLFRVQHNGGGSFAVRGIEVGDPDLISAKLMDDGSARLHNIRVDLADGADVAELDGPASIPVLIRTDDPDVPSVEVVVRVTRGQPAGSRRPAVSRRPLPRTRVLRPGPTPTPGGGG